MFQKLTAEWPCVTFMEAIFDVDVARCTLAILFVGRLMDDLYLNHAANPRRNDGAVLVSWGYVSESNQVMFEFRTGNQLWATNCYDNVLSKNLDRSRERLWSHEITGVRTELPLANPVISLLHIKDLFSISMLLPINSLCRTHKHNRQVATGFKNRTEHTLKHFLIEFKCVVKSSSQLTQFFVLVYCFTSPCVQMMQTLANTTTYCKESSWDVPERPIILLEIRFFSTHSKFRMYGGEKQCKRRLRLFPAI